MLIQVFGIDLKDIVGLRTGSTSVGDILDKALGGNFAALEAAATKAAAEGVPDGVIFNLISKTQKAFEEGTKIDKAMDVFNTARDVYFEYPGLKEDEDAAQIAIDKAIDDAEKAKAAEQARIAEEVRIANETKAAEEAAKVER